MWLKFERMGVAPQFMCALKSLYKDVIYSVKLNVIMSEFFSLNVGLKQGCLISPQLFNLYIREIQNIGLGIPTDEDLISILLYADDIALLVQCETDLQQIKWVVLTLEAQGECP